MMRGTDKRSGELFSYVDLEQRVRADHPLRAIRKVVGTALAALSGDFAGLYSGMGRPSIAPEMLLRAMLLQAFYWIRSEHQLIERREFNLFSRLVRLAWGGSSALRSFNVPRPTRTICGEQHRGRVPKPRCCTHPRGGGCSRRGQLGRRDP